MGLRGLGEGAQGLMCGSSGSRTSEGLRVHNTGPCHLGSMLLLLLLLLLLRLLLLAEAEQL